MESCWNVVSYAHIPAQMMVMGYVLYRFAKPFMQESNGEKPFPARVHKKTLNDTSPRAAFAIQI